MTEPDEVILALNQHTAMDPKVIGFTGYQVPARRLLHLTVPIFREFVSSLDGCISVSRNQVFSISAVYKSCYRPAKDEAA